VNILSVNTFFPYPPRRGMDVIYLNLLRLQAQDHRVTVVTLQRTAADQAHAGDLESICHRTVMVSPGHAVRFAVKVWRRLLYSLLSVVRWQPRCTLYGAPPELAREIARLLATETFDLVEIHHSTSASLQDVVRNRPTALYLYDVHYRAKARAAATKRGFGRLVARLGVSQFRRFERRAMGRSRALLLGQEEDRAEVARVAHPGAVVELMPNVIDTDAVRPGADDEIRPRSLVFVGAMTHQPNVDAILTFHRTIWPQLRAGFPDAQWTIVGAAPPPEIVALDGREGVQVHANVPDVRPFIAAAAVYIAPLRIGSGVKVKIMEALAMGKAIVATPVAAEGMGLEPGRDLVVTELGPTFSAAVAGLWQDAGARHALQRHAREAAVARFSVNAGRETLNRIYDRLHAEQAV
jgi:polysaccharide biosynthesis protein PslH